MTNKLHFSMNIETLLHVSTIIYNHLHGTSIYTDTTYSALAHSLVKL